MAKYNLPYGGAQGPLHNNDLQQSRRFASTVSGAGRELRRDQRKRALAGRAAEIKRVRTHEFRMSRRYGEEAAAALRTQGLPEAVS